jgi:hypothetical protein
MGLEQIEFATWYEYADLEPGKARGIGAFLALASGKPHAAGYLQGFLGSCGLFGYDGRAKPAAWTWCEEAAAYYEFRQRR